jgi:phosphate transport system protein
MRNRFDDELMVLRDSMKQTGVLCESSIEDATDALLSGNFRHAQDAVEIHTRIHHSTRDIESICLKLLMQQQPVASDLRLISSALKTVYDLERIGEMSADISEIVINEQLSAASDILNLKEMSNSVIVMVHDSIESLNTKDVKLAASVIEMDDTVDADFINSKKLLVERFTKDANVEYALNLLMIAKYFEKIGDHAVHIAKWAVYNATGVRDADDKLNEGSSL